MSFGKMNAQIEIVKKTHFTDDDGFAVNSNVVLATVKSYREQRGATEFWANRATFSKATDMFQFRTIPVLKITTDMIIRCDDTEFEILSVDSLRGKGMYIEILASEVKPSG